MVIRFPAPLAPGDTVAVTSPSSGVAERLHGRLAFAVQTLKDAGYKVVVGECMDGATHISAPAVDRAKELTAFLTDATVRAVVPPWGGETAIDLLPLLDWDAIREADPTWFVGYSDISTLITPMTLLTGVATIHGNNLMDTPYRAPDGLLRWLDVVQKTAGDTFTQTSPSRFRIEGWDDWEAHPDASEFTLDGTGTWTRLDDGTGEVDVTGRLIGGCIETMCNVAGTPYGDVSKFAAEHAPEDLIVYVEAAEDNALTICRNLHGMRLAGFFDYANAILVGRTRGADTPHLTQHEAVLDALGTLGLPIVGDVECGHVPPYMPIVNGALGHLRHGTDGSNLTQTLA